MVVVASLCKRSVNFSWSLRKPVWAAGLKFGPRGLTGWHFTRMPGVRQRLFVPDKLPLQTEYAGLSSKHEFDSTPGNSVSINHRIGAGHSSWLPCCFDLSLLLPRDSWREPESGQVALAKYNNLSERAGPACNSKTFIFNINEEWSASRWNYS